MNLMLEKMNIITIITHFCEFTSTALQETNMVLTVCAQSEIWIFRVLVV